MATGQAPTVAGGDVHSISYPDGKQFAFTILDDTDDSTLENIAPVYELLSELGLRTTKTVWTVDCPEGSDLFFAADTLEQDEYREYVRSLQKRGFEIAWHNATMETSDRLRTIRALERFRKEFGFYPKVHANHGYNRENIYWGGERYRNFLLRSLFRFKRDPKAPTASYLGHKQGSRYFWGDLCRKHFKFVRNFTFYELNLLKTDPHTPYRLSSTPYVNYWFSAADAPDAFAFNRLVTRQRLDQLHREGGICILATHLGKFFAPDGKLDPQFADTMRYLSKLPGWFVPVSDILEYLLQRRGEAPSELPLLARWRLEFRHVFDRVKGLPS